MIKCKYKIMNVIIIFVFVTTTIIFCNLKKTENNFENNSVFLKIQEQNVTYNQIENDKKKTNINEKIENNKAVWLIKIPEIDLTAEINEGTSQDVMNKYVGHFKETQIEYGNVGLAAHNRGYPVNFFQNIKKLEIGSEIINIHEDFKMIYVVKTIEIIENTNWNYLKKTEDNRITLITCVENEPKYRRCIQGVEKIEREE